MEPLKEWTINFFKHKDLTQRKLERVEDTGENIIFHCKDKKITYLVREKLEDKIILDIEKLDQKSVVSLNSEENFNFLVKHWGKLSKIKNLTMIFVNMKTDDKWLINPYLHSMIADPSTVKTGLRTMFDTANGKIAEIKKGKRKPKLFDDDVPEEDEADEE